MTQPPPPSERAPSAQLVGARIDRYVLLERIAEGGMGVVFAAYDSELDRKVAIKLLRPTLEKSHDESGVQARLLREAQAMARLSHPNVVAVHDVGTHEGTVFLAMEYVSGGTLKERIRKPGPWRERLALLEAAGRGLAAAHAAGLVHRDFKPENVLVGNDGRVRVTDFGIARSAEDLPATRTARARLAALHPDTAPATKYGQPSSAAPAVTNLPSGSASVSSSGSLSDPLTVTGDVLGTVGYMAPEQAFGEAVDARSDQFSFCATVYVALYGEKPFAGDDLNAYTRAISGPVRDAPASSNVPAWVRRVLVKGLSAEPSDRYASMEELLYALGDDPAARRKRWLTVGGAVVVAALAVLVYVRTVQHEDRSCEGAGDLSSTWDPAVREDVRRAFEATAAPGARDSFERASKVLDAYTAGWSTRTVGICEAAKGRMAAPDESSRLRTECLDRARTELHALVSVFRRADRGTVEQSVGAAYGLTSLSWCDDVNALRASPGLPADPAKRKAVLDARAVLADASSLRLAGKSAESVEKAERAIAIAREVGHRSTEAEALFFVAHNRQSLGDYARAEGELQNAMAVAYAAKDDVVLIRTASDLAFIEGDKLYRPEDAHRVLAFANAGLERVGGGEDLETDVLSTEALLLITEGYADRAVPMLERVVRIERRLLGETPVTAIYLNDLGYAQHLAGKNDEALPVLAEARAMLDSIYGNDRFDAGIPLCNLGAASLALGRREDATKYLQRALEVFERENPGGFWSAWALQYLSLAATLDGDASGGLAYGRRGLEIAERLASSRRIFPGVAVVTGDALLASGKPEEALALCNRALDVEEQVHLFAPDKILDWDALRCRGEALLALGRPAEAIAPLERSLALPRRALPWDLARAQLVLAQVLDKTGDASRAAKLRSEAHGALPPVPERDR